MASKPYNIILVFNGKIIPPPPPQKKRDVHIKISSVLKVMGFVSMVVVNFFKAENGGS